MENLDLDINNYSIHDLEVFFQFSPDKKYVLSDVETKEYVIREQLLSSGQVDRRFKSKLIEFLTLAKERLIDAKCPPIKPPTTVPSNQKLDPYDYPVSRPPPPRTEQLTPHPEAQFVYTNPSEFFQGTLNPLNTRILTKCLNIDTRFRENLYTSQSSDFTIQLPIKLYKVVSLELASIDFCSEFYGISGANGNNFLYMQVFYSTAPPGNTGHDAARTFIVPDGNYTNADLVSKINALLSPTDPNSHSLLFPDDIFSYIQLTLDINENGSGTNKITIATVPGGLYSADITKIVLDFTKDINGNADLNSLTNNTGILSKIGWNLGFIRPFYEGNVDTAPLTGDSAMDTATIKNVYLAIEDFNNSTNEFFVGVFKNSLMNQSILARISVKKSMDTGMDLGLQRITTEPRRYFGPVDIQRLRIRLYDEMGRIVPMYNSNFSFCLTLKMLYDL